VIKNLIKTFSFLEENRTRLDLTGGLRLNPGRARVDLPRLELPRQDAPDDHLYNTSTTLIAKTWVTTPMSVKEWRGFEVIITHPRDPDGGAAVLTSAFYRLGDGVDEYYWDGGDWVVAGATDWSTEAEIANNIDSFPATAKALQVIINLRTSDERITPELSDIKVLYGAVIDHQEDYLIRSLIPSLKANVRPAGRTLIEYNGGTTVVTQDYEPETPYNIVDVEAVYNENTDSAHLYDLLDSYNQSTQTITLTSDPGMTNLFIRFLYEPEVALNTSRDYVEVGKVPAITIERVRVVDTANRGVHDSVVNKDSGEAVVVYGPRQGDIEFDLVMETDKILDQQRLAQAVRDYMSTNPRLVSVGMDEQFRLWLLDEYDSFGDPNKADISSGRLRARIVGAVFFERGSESKTAVSSLRTSPNSNLQIQVP
jgi:hypothetical protein